MVEDIQSKLKRYKASNYCPSAPGNATKHYQAKKRWDRAIAIFTGFSELSVEMKLTWGLRSEASEGLEAIKRILFEISPGGRNGCHLWIELFRGDNGAQLRLILNP